MAHNQYKLSAKEDSNRSNLVEELNLRWNELHDTITDYNRQIVSLGDTVAVALEKYNEAVEEAKNFVNEIATNAENAWDENSEKWQESDRGGAAKEWFEEYQNVEMDDLEIDLPSELEVDEPEHAANLENLPTEAEEG